MLPALAAPGRTATGVTSRPLSVMSSSPPPPSLLCCPACAQLLRAPPADGAPITLAPCGHSLCMLCGEAVLAVAAPACPVCSCTVLDSAVNLALGALGEAGALAAEAQSSLRFPVAISPSQCCGRHPTHPLHAFCQSDNTVLCEACDRTLHAGHEVVPLASLIPAVLTASVERLAGLCGAGAAALPSAIAVVERVKADLVTSRAAAVAAAAGVIESLKAALDAHLLTVVARVDCIVAARMKALDSQLDELSVSACQLAAGAAVCGAALAGSTSVPMLAQAAHASTRMAAMAKAFTGPVATPMLSVRTDTGPLLQTLANCVSVQTHTLAVASCELVPPGPPHLAGYVAGEVNTLALRCVDARGEAADWLCPGDVSAVITTQGDGDGAPPVPVGSLVSVTLTGSGAATLSYTVDTGHTGGISVAVCVARQPLPLLSLEALVPVFPGSNITVPSKARAAFAALPDVARLTLAAPSLLYRASVHGHLPRDFHRVCDGKGRTLTVIRCVEGWVLGAYVGDAAWPSSHSGAVIADPRAFLFTLTNPHGLPPSLFPVNSTTRTCSGFSAAHLGPTFGRQRDVSIVARRGEVRFPLDYLDSEAGLGCLTFTGGPTFDVAEVEVWQLPAKASAKKALSSSDSELDSDTNSSNDTLSSDSSDSDDRYQGPSPPVRNAVQVPRLFSAGPVAARPTGRLSPTSSSHSDDSEEEAPKPAGKIAPKPAAKIAPKLAPAKAAPAKPMPVAAHASRHPMPGADSDEDEEETKHKPVASVKRKAVPPAPAAMSAAPPPEPRKPAAPKKAV